MPKTIINDNQFDIYCCNILHYKHQIIFCRCAKFYINPALIVNFGQVFQSFLTLHIIKLMLTGFFVPLVIKQFSCTTDIN